MQNYLSLCIFGISTFFLDDTIARDAIIGGTKARVNEFSYQVSLQHPEFGHMCGGGIIGDQFILTAGHCVVTNAGHINNSSLSILAGTNSLYNTKAPAVTVRVKKIFVPMNFNVNVYGSGDIAVLMLLYPLGLGHHQNLNVLNLPPSKHKSYVGATAEIAGFGWNHIYRKDNGTVLGANVDGLLRFANSHVRAECHNNFFKYIFRSAATQNYICVSLVRHVSRPRGTCYGDSGGPLVHERRTVIGVLSTGSPDCLETVIGSKYTRVAHYLDFIYNSVQDKKHKDILTLQLIP